MMSKGFKRTLALLSASTIVFGACSLDGAGLPEEALTATPVSHETIEKTFLSVQDLFEEQQASKNEVEAPAAEEEIAEPEEETVFVSEDLTRYATAQFSIRTTPESDGHVAGTMYYGKEVHVTGISEDGQWSRIEFLGGEAYVMSACLTEEKPEIIVTEETPAEETEAEETAATTEQTETPAQTEAAEEEQAYVETYEEEDVVYDEPEYVEEEEEEEEEDKSYDINYPSSGTIEYELFILVNEAREDAGLHPYSWSWSLADAAEIRAEEISDYFSHDRPDGGDCFDLSGVYAENIAAGQSSAQEVFDDWMNSDGHRSNILDPDYVTCGFAFYEDSDCEYEYYWAQEFGY